MGQNDGFKALVPIRPIRSRFGFIVLGGRSFTAARRQNASKKNRRAFVQDDNILVTPFCPTICLRLNVGKGIMNILYLLLPAALILVLVFVGFYLWAAKKGQFDDLETPAHRILLDDNIKKKNNNKDRKDVDVA